MGPSNKILNKFESLAKLLWLPALLCALLSHAHASPLFESQDILDIILEAPMRDLSKQRHTKPEYAGIFRYSDVSGAEHALGVLVSTRGRSRLEICDYPPLKLTFDPNETAGTLLDGQRELKLVRQCMRGGAGRDWMHLELGAYRAYNAITDYSFMARQLNATFRDTESRFRRDEVLSAFLLEDDRDMAKRLDRRRIRPPRVEPEQMALTETTHHLLFQYLIGNTDFAVKRGPKGEACCHNGRVLTETGRRQEWIIVPYDFDYAGIINTEYAVPHETLPIRRVTTRLYRGFCWQNDELKKSIVVFNSKRKEIEAAMLPPEVSRNKSRRVKHYLDRFYRIINDPEELQEHLLDKCRGPDSLPIHESIVTPRFVKTP